MPNPLTLASWPALSSSTAVATSSWVDSRSLPSRTATRSESRSSPVSETRSAASVSTYAANSALAMTASASCSGVRFSSYILTIACDQGRSRWRSASGQPSSSAMTRTGSGSARSAMTSNEPSASRRSAQSSSRPGGQLLDPGPEPGHVAAAERALDQPAQPGVLRRLAVEDRVGVQPVEGLPLVLGFPRPEDPAQAPARGAPGCRRRGWSQPRSRARRARRPAPRPGGRRRRGTGRRRRRVRQVQQLGGVHGDHDASVGSGAATCRGSSWSPILRARWVDRPMRPAHGMGIGADEGDPVASLTSPA